MYVDMSEILPTTNNADDAVGSIVMARCVHPSFCLEMKRCMANCDGDSPLLSGVVELNMTDLAATPIA